MATNAVYEKRGTSITWTNTGGNKLLNAKGLAHTTGRLGAFYDRGAGAAPCEYEMRVYTKWAANPTLATDFLRFAVVESDGTHQDAGVAFHETNDAAILVAPFNTLLNVVGNVLPHTADTNEKGTKRIVRISSRYFAPALFNTGATALVDTDSLTAVVFTPLYPDIQAAA